MYMYIYIYIYIHTYVYIHKLTIYIYIYTYIYTSVAILAQAILAQAILAQDVSPPCSNLIGFSGGGSVGTRPPHTPFPPLLPFATLRHLPCFTNHVHPASTI